jgi:hypothetical protein
MSDDEERPRKSWREIDNARDRSAHRREERPGGAERKRGPGSQKSYRATLDRLFETGKIAELVDGPGASEGPESESRIRMLARIEKAMDKDSICREVDAYLAKFGELPDDLEILGKVLEHRDAERQRQAMERIDKLLDSARPKRQRAMVAQLKIIRDLAYDKEMTQLAGKLIGRLE